MNETRKQRLMSTHARLLTERSSWDPHWKAISEVLYPRRPRFLETDRNKGSRMNQNILDNYATIACRTLSSGMMAGITSPTRPWFRLGVEDPDLTAFGPVRTWLETTRTRMNNVFSRSNIYTTFSNVYSDVGGMGTAGLSVLEDYADTIRTATIPVGSFVFSLNSRGTVDTVFRTVEMTVRQVVETFAEPGMKNIPENVRNMWDHGNYNNPISVVQAIFPNILFNEEHSVLDPTSKRFSSVYYTKNENRLDVFLRESGFDEMPVLGVRWSVTEGDAYGSTCPGMEALGDIRGLQMLSRRTAQAEELGVLPPMVAPSSLRNTIGSKKFVPGGISYYPDHLAGSAVIKSAFDVGFRVDWAVMRQQDYRERISRAFYEDLFAMLTNTDRREITATEVAERHEEKLLLLGPMLERLNDEMLDPLIDRTFSVMLRAGMIPEPPKEIQGQDIQVEYISTMAQAQKMAATSSIDRLLAFTAAGAQLNPEIVDVWDFDRSVNLYADMLGAPSGILRDGETINAVRTARVQAEEEAKSEESRARLVENMATMSEASGEKIDGETARQVVGGE